MIRRPPRSTRVRSSAASDVYKRQAIGSVRSCKMRSDMSKENHIIQLPPARTASLPSVVATDANIQQRTQSKDGQFCLLGIDETESHRLVSLAKKAVAFFKRSRSWRKSSFSLRRRASSFSVSSLSLIHISEP